MENRVLDEDSSDLANPFLVGEREGTRLAVRFERVVPPAADAAELRCERLRGLPEIHRGHFHVQTARVEPGEVEEVGRELREALDLEPHLGEKLTPRFLVHVLVGEQLDVASEGKDRRPQLVGGVGDELATSAFQRRQLLAHAVERPGQLPDLVRARVDYRLIEAATRNPLCSALEPVHAPRKNAREEESDEGCGKQRNHTGGKKTLANEGDDLQRVGDGGGYEQHERSTEGNGNLGELRAASRYDSVARPAGLHRPVCDRIARGLSQRPRLDDGVQVDRRRLAEHLVDRDAQATPLALP